jgi:hypothetical protein
VGNSVVTYFVQAEQVELIKIGRATSVQKRIDSLRCGSPVRLHLLGILKGDREAEMHQRFRRWRQHGEWFKPAQELLDFIDAEALAVRVRPGRLTLNERVSKAIARTAQLRADAFLPEHGRADGELIGLYIKARPWRKHFGRRPKWWVELDESFRAYDSDESKLSRAVARRTLLADLKEAIAEYGVDHGFGRRAESPSPVPPPSLAEGQVQR